MAGYMFDWQHCGRERFEAIVEALLVRKHQRENSGRAEAVDGRGGDDGIDVDVTLDDDTLDTIYQLKYFPEGMSGGFAKTRREQVRRSFKAAMKLAPRRWVLVVPCNLTPKERSWVRSLAGTVCVIVKTMNVTDLELELAKSPDIYRHFMQDPLLEALKIAGNEHALLRTPQEIEAAASSLGERLSALSTSWNISARTLPDGTFEQTITPKRLDAGEREPLGFVVAVRPDDDEARHAIESFTAGAPELLLRPEQVVALRLQGPPWFAEEWTGSGLQVRRPTSRRTLPVEVRLCDESGSSLASLTGSATAAPRAGGVFHLSLDLRGGLHLDFTMQPPTDSDSGTVGPAAIKLTFTDQLATDLVAARAFLDKLAVAQRAELWVNNQQMMALRVGSLTPTGDADAFTIQLIDDLAVIARYANVELTMPARVTRAERREIRKCRLLLDGATIQEPDFGQLTGLLSGGVDASLRNFIKADAVAVMTEATAHYLVLGHKIAIPVQVFHPQAHVLDAAAILESLDAGTAAGRQLVAAGADGSPFRVYAPSRGTGSSDPVPLGIEGDPFDAEPNERQQSSRPEAARPASG